MKCLEEGIFARTTLKPLNSVFNLDKEKRYIKVLVENGEWFTVSGLRRTGKTTLVRSVISAMDVYSIYINLWGRTSERITLDIILEEITKMIKELAEKGRLKEILKYIDKVSFIGVTIQLKTKNQSALIETIKRLTKKKRVVIIIDEAEEMISDAKVFKFLAALHDELAPSLSVVLLGSVVSMKKMLSSSVSSPLYGRIGNEIILKPFDEANSRELLRAGFEQCNFQVDEELITEGALRLGGFAGWLTSFGRTVVIEHQKGADIKNIRDILETLENDAAKMIYEEIARILYGKKMLRGYIKIIKAAAENGYITVSEGAKIIERKPNTTLNYLRALVNNGILIKEKDFYKIADPLVRRVALKPNFESEVKLRL